MFVKVAPQAGQQEKDAWQSREDFLGELIKILTADVAGVNDANAQPWFPSAGGVTVEADKSYLMDGFLFLTTGNTTHTTALSFTGTATLNSILYEAITKSAAADTISTALSSLLVQAATATVLNATSTAVTTWISIRGVLRTTLGGTLIPNFKFSADPTGTILVKKNSFFRLKPVGDARFVSQGSWA